MKNLFDMGYKLGQSQHCKLLYDKKVGVNSAQSEEEFFDEIAEILENKCKIFCVCPDEIRKIKFYSSNQKCGEEKQKCAECQKGIQFLKDKSIEICHLKSKFRHEIYEIFYKILNFREIENERKNS